MPKSKQTDEIIEIDYKKRLPDAEFDVMKAIWEAEPPVNTSYLMEKVGNNKNWKAPTLISFLVRLEQRGFITSTKKSKERLYIPLADQTRYIQNMTNDFIDSYHDGSFVNLMDVLYRDKVLSEDDIDGLLAWLKTKY